MHLEPDGVREAFSLRTVCGGKLPWIAARLARSQRRCSKLRAPADFAAHGKCEADASVVNDPVIPGAKQHCLSRQRVRFR
jgi:hypothetical protein